MCLGTGHDGELVCATVVIRARRRRAVWLEAGAKELALVGESSRTWDVRESCGVCMGGSMVNVVMAKKRLCLDQLRGVSGAVSTQITRR